MSGCQDGWIEFTCKYPKPNGNYKSIDVVHPKKNIRSTKVDKWENKDRVSLYHDTKNEKLRVAIKPLQKQDFGVYNCSFYKGSISSRVVVGKRHSLYCVFLINSLRKHKENKYKNDQM